MVMDSTPPLWLIGSQVGGYTPENPPSSMVLRSISEPESSPANMASSIKSQSARNSPIDGLKWSPAGPSRAQQGFYRQLADSSTTQCPLLRDFVGPDDGKPHHLSLSDLPLIPARKAVETHDEGNRDQLGDVAAVARRSSKILVRFRVKEKPCAPPPADTEETAAAQAPVDQGGAPAASRSPVPVKSEELTPNPRNLRPRRPLMGKNYKTGNGSTVNKVKFSIHLKKEEIEADLLAMIGSKRVRRPTRRPTKRTRVVQQSLDSCFPGLWLANITADSYKVIAKPSKG
ncbi:hypothetical protein SAY87_025281 [Trapa incisa]|uniref:DUF1639 family protein n=1 Tax=Trapa incisa TaxID=236973 RepID=A0AAN7GL85_9MYRT|nr:hypothetical protein SAY87_025281 [Trapa incisa]